METKYWTPESLGMPDRQNYLLWKDMENAYDYVETYARFSISGNLENFLFKLIRRRWNLACSDTFEPPPERFEEGYATRVDLGGRRIIKKNS